MKGWVVVSGVVVVVVVGGGGGGGGLRVFVVSGLRGGMRGCVCLPHLLRLPTTV